MTYRAIYDRLHYEGFIQEAVMTAIEETSVRQSSASATSSATSIRTLLKSRTTQPADTAGQADWRGLNNPNTHSVHGLIRPWIA